MSVVLFCPNLKCRAVLQVSEKTRGKKVRCGQCGTAFMVPVKTPAKTEKPAPAKPVDAPT
jgi:predicted Zn finger-like uncharacterized protein